LLIHFIFFSGVFRTVDGFGEEASNSQFHVPSDSGEGLNQKQLLPDGTKQMIPAKIDQSFSDKKNQLWPGNNNQLFSDGNKDDFDNISKHQYPKLNNGNIALKVDRVVSSVLGNELDDDQLTGGSEDGLGRTRRFRRQEQPPLNNDSQEDLSGDMSGVRVRKLFL
jgi:hypothetical protein